MPGTHAGAGGLSRLDAAHLVFDLDGTLIDSAVQCVAIINAMRRDRGCATDDVAAADWRTAVGHGAVLVADHLREWARDPDADVAEFRARYAVMPTSRDQVFAGAQSVLAGFLATGAQLSVCSAKPQRLCEQVLADTGLDRFFAIVVGHVEGHPCKPDPRHIETVLRQSDGPRRACYIGDMDVDRRTADAAGIAFVLMNHLDDLLTDTPAERVANGFAELPAIMREIMGLATVERQ